MNKFRIKRNDKYIFVYSLPFRFLIAYLQRFFIGYWILKTRLDFYPASNFL